MNELALFAGTGGGILGGHLLGWRTVCAVEKVPYRREVLLRRQRDGVLPMFPIWDDCGTFDGNPWAGRVDVVSAGFPCQPFSPAGRRKGADDSRNGWPDTIRIIREVRPRYCFLENVPGLLTSGYFGTVLGGLAEAGYDAVWTVLGADDVGAPHRRKRLWILAYASSLGKGRLPVRPGRPRQAKVDADRASEGGRVRWWDTDPADLPDASKQGLEKREGERRDIWQEQPTAERGGSSADLPDPDESHGQRGGCSVQMGRIGSQGEAAEGSHAGGDERCSESRVGRLAHGLADDVDKP